jgi:fatty-acyl-CoA synthase
MSNKPNPYEQDLDKSPANYAPLTPLSFLERAAYVCPERVSVVHGTQRYTWKETYARCRRLASALAKRGIGRGDTVAAMLPNIPAMYEMHVGVPMCGGVLNTLNTRLDADAIVFMLDHGEAELLFTDREFFTNSGSRDDISAIVRRHTGAADNGQIVRCRAARGG